MNRFPASVSTMQGDIRNMGIDEVRQHMVEPNSFPNV
jgi:hypothetical protein